MPRAHPAATQVDVFQRIGAPIVEHAFKGFNVCIFAYGQTGSGKTHSMMGESTSHLMNGGALIESDGLTPRICHAIFNRKAVCEKAEVTWDVRASYVEVYNERVKDLLVEVSGNKSEDWLDVRQQKDGTFFVNTTTIETPDLRTIMQLLAKGRTNLHMAATKMNDCSSRSHSILQLILTENLAVDCGERGIILSVGKSAKINLVDLAGSERVGDSKVTGQQFNEATKINLSLTTLGRVIDALADPSTNNIPPYRESTLTKLLKDSLGGNSKTTMIATVSPSILNLDESHGTLRYASRAREIVNVAFVNEDPKVRQIRKLEEELARYRSQMTLPDLPGGKDMSYYTTLEQKFTLAQQELVSRAAELRQLDLEKQARQKAEEIATASQNDKARLQQEAVELGQRLRASKKELEQQHSELQKLRDVAEEQAKKMLQKNKTLQEKQVQLEQLQQNVTTERVTLQQTITELGNEKIKLKLEREAHEKTSALLHKLQAELKGGRGKSRRTVEAVSVYDG